MKPSLRSSFTALGFLFLLLTGCSTNSPAPASQNPMTLLYKGQPVVALSATEADALLLVARGAKADQLLSQMGLPQSKPPERAATADGAESSDGVELETLYKIQSLGTMEILVIDTERCRGCPGVGPIPPRTEFDKTMPSVFILRPTGE